MNNDVARVQLAGTIRDTGKVVVVNHTFVNVRFAHSGPTYDSDHMIAL